MSGETENQVSGWTVDTLKEFMQAKLADAKDQQQAQMADMRAMLDERAANGTKAIDAALVAADKLVQQALASAEKAVTKAETASEKRLEGVNEFRAQLTDQAATFIRREEVDIRVNAVGDKQAAAEQRTIERLSAIEKRLDTTQGERTGARVQVAESRDTGRYTATIIGAALAVAGLLSFLLSLKNP